MKRDGKLVWEAFQLRMADKHFREEVVEFAESASYLCLDECRKEFIPKKGKKGIIKF